MAAYLSVAPITLREARRFIAENHRHSGPPQGWLFGCALLRCGEMVGVGIAGRPNARGLQDGLTVEVTRVCVLEGERNGCSMLYGALCRAAKALGYRRAITFTLGEEDGASARSAGFLLAAELEERDDWVRPLGDPTGARYGENLFGQPTRPRGAKRRWERAL